MYNELLMHFTSSVEMRSVVWRAKKAGDQIGAKREQNKIKQLDGEIRNLL
jgi:hypothetical protein